MSGIWRGCVAGILAIWVIAGAAQDVEPEPGQETAAQSETDANATAEPDASAVDGDESAETEQPAPESIALDELFIPSQEIRADEEVIFPVNI